MLLDTIDSLSTTHPDSALILLSGTHVGAGVLGDLQSPVPARSIDGKPVEPNHLPALSAASLSHRQLMRMELLRARAMNKAYVDFTTDSVLLAVTDYYDSHGTPNERMEAHYLLGCAYRDMGEAQKTLQCYQEAADCADSLDTSCDYNLLMSICGQMAELYHAMKLPEDEIQMREEIMKFARVCNDTLKYIRGFELMTKPYYLLGDTARVIDIIERSHQMYMDYGDPQMAVNAYATLGHIYTLRGELTKAHEAIEEYERNSGLFDEEGNIRKGYEAYYYVKGTYCMETGQVDSAEHFFRKIPSGPSEIDAYRGLLAVCQHRREADSVAKYSLLFEEAVDSRNNISRMEAIHQMTSFYNYHRIQEKLAREELASSRATTAAIALSALVVILLVCAYLIFRWYKEKKKEQLEKISTEYLIASERLESLQSELDSTKLSSEELLRDKQEKEDEVKELKEKIGMLEARYRKVSSVSARSQIEESDIMKVMRKKAQWKRGSCLPSVEEWMKLMKLFKLNFPTYYSQLFLDGKLAAQEARACMLLLLDFSENDIAVLFDVKPQRITNIKNRANAKLFGEATATTLLDNIRRSEALV